MSTAIQAAWQDGFTPVYTVATYSEFVLDSITFDLVTDSSGQPHYALVQIDDSSGLTPYTLQDSNTASDSSYYHYNFFRGATMSHCTLDKGDTVESPLPTTVLAAQSAIRLYSVGTNGTLITGDVISNVCLYGDQLETTDPNAPSAPLLSITLLPGVAA